jgi:hypothetical protein
LRIRAVSLSITKKISAMVHMPSLPTLTAITTSVSWMCLDLAPTKATVRTSTTKYIAICCNSYVYLRANSLSPITAVPQTTRRVTLEVRFDEETEAEKSALALQDKLKPLEQELVRIESVAHEVKSEAMHTREREATHRDTSGSLALGKLRNFNDCPTTDITILRVNRVH